MTILPFLWKSRGKAGMKLEKKVEPLLDLVGLTDRRDHYPSQLSGGQTARRYCPRPCFPILRCFFVTASTSALDPQTTESILELLRDINKRLHITIVMITHQMNVVKEICDHVAVIEGGRIIERVPSMKSSRIRRIRRPRNLLQVPGRILSRNW